jgi:RNA polymerase sigma-70 factor (ECF subfamily)
VYVLREAFDYPFREIASILAISEANARQLARRARIHLAERRVRPVAQSEGEELLAAFVHAARAGEMSGLVALLTCEQVAAPNAHPGPHRRLAQVAS